MILGPIWAISGSPGLGGFVDPFGSRTRFCEAKTERKPVFRSEGRQA
jgi:hypothetical protein